MSDRDHPDRGLAVEPGGFVSRFEVAGYEGVEFEVALEVGHTYVLAKTGDLLMWEVLEEFEATQRVNAFMMPQTDTKCYYRVRRKVQ